MEKACIEWPNARTSEGYGVKTVEGRPYYVHRWIVEQVEGPLSSGEVVRHRCDNPPCFLYEHLMRGTYSQNIQEAYDRGLRGPCYQLAKTHCPQGHPYDYTSPEGKRACRTCRKEAARRHYERKRNAD